MAGSRKIVDDYVQISSRGVGGVESALGRVHGAAQRAYGAMSNIAQITVGNALAAGFSKLVSIAASVPSTMISANAAYETAAVSMEVLLGSATKAKERIAALSEFAASTPFEMPGILQASKQLEMAQIPAEKHLEVLRMTGDMASAAGKDISDVGMWVSRAYGAIQGGKPWGDAAQALSEMGVLSVEARNRLEKLSQSGASSAKVWAAFQEEMGRFKGMTEANAATFSGMASTMSDNIRNLLKDAGAPLFDFAKNVLGEFNAMFSGEEMAAGIESFRDGFANALESIGQFLAPLVPMWMDMWNAIIGIGGDGTFLMSLFEGIGGVAHASIELTYSLFTALAEVMGEVAGLINDAIIAGLGLLGVKFESTGEIAGSMFDRLIEGIDWVAQRIRNWDLTLEYVYLAFANLGFNIFEVLKAIGQNAMTVFMNLPDFAAAAGGAIIDIFTNLGKNIVALWNWAWGKLTGEEVELNLTNLFEGVEERFKNLPELVTPALQSMGERFGDELDRMKREENRREAELEQRKEAARKKARQLAPGAQEDEGAAEGAGGVDQGQAGSSAAASALANRNKGAKGKEKKGAGDLVDSAEVWSRLQKAAMEAKEGKGQEGLLKDGNKQRQEANQHLGVIAEAAKKGFTPVFA